MSEREVMFDAVESDFPSRNITQPPLSEGAITWHRYVPHYRLLAYLMAGWRYDCDLGDHHGTYCVLMTWVGGSEPMEPI